MNEEASGKLPTAQVLIVEDTPSQALLLRDILERSGYGVTAAKHGEEALEILQRQKPALVITDINMPRMDGYELCRRIKAAPESRNIPVMLLTSLSAPQDIVRGLECGADNFIVKPYDEAFLLSRIHFVLANHELRTTAGAEMPITVYFAGQRYSITADRLQILNLLLSTYETAVQRNQALIEAREALEAKARELSRSNRELEQFGYIVSHDLQEPLRMVTGHLGLIQRRYRDKLDAPGLEFLQFAIDGATRMHHLIRDLLAYSRVGARRNALEPVDLQAVWNDALANLNAAVAESHAAITHDALPTVPGDRTLLLQLLQNLVGNAIKFRGSEPPRIHLSAARQGGRWLCSVTDNGIGIAPEHRERVFQVFQRLHASGEYPGTGIGLAVCKKIVEYHGGTIWVEAPPEKGATFFFTIGHAAS